MPDGSVMLTGIPTSQRFAEVLPLPKTREDGRLQVLFTSATVGPFAQVLEGLEPTDPLSVVVVVGNSDGAEVRRISRLAARLRNTARGESNPCSIQVIPYEKRMDLRMNDADILVGKAGGLTTTEALVAGRPILFCGSTPGNELANEAYVVEAGAAASALPSQVRTRLLQLHYDRDTLHQMAFRARSIARPQAASEILEGALKSVSLPQTA